VNADNVVLSQGFNGPPRRFPDHKINWQHPSRHDYVIHAEENAILFGLALHGDVVGSTLYVTGRPCARCVRLAVHMALRRIVFGGVESSMADSKDWELALRMALWGQLHLKEYGSNAV